MNKYIITACVSLAIAIILGAFGAHAWKEVLIGHESTYETAHQYHLAMSIGILTLTGIQSASGRWKRVALTLILAGMILFSGSLYMLSFPEVFQGSIRMVLGPVTPIGGLLMICGWASAAYAFYLGN